VLLTNNQMVLLLKVVPISPTDPEIEVFTVSLKC